MRGEMAECAESRAVCNAKNRLRELAQWLMCDASSAASVPTKSGLSADEKREVIFRVVMTFCAPALYSGSAWRWCERCICLENNATQRIASMPSEYAVVHLGQRLQAARRSVQRHMLRLENPREARIYSAWRAITCIGRSAALFFLQISRYLLQKPPCIPSRSKRRASTRINPRFPSRYCANRRRCR